jgi:outer membrane protein assembly factor BamB
MFRKALLFSTALTLLGFSAALADEPIKHRIMFAEYGNTQNRLVQLDAAGKITWEYKPPSICVFFQILPNGNIVYSYGGNPTGVDEITPDKKIVWTYHAKCPQVICCLRLDNGHTLVGQQGPPQIVEVDHDGKTVHVTPCTTSEVPYHRQVRGIRSLPEGHLLVAHEGEGAIREYDPLGKVVWQYEHVDNTGDSIRLPNGNTLISGATQKRVLEVTPAGKIAWEFTDKDAPELNLTWVSSLQVLKNGHYLIGNFLRGAEGKGAHAFEVTKDKKVVWTWGDHKLARSITTVRVMDDE